MPRRSLVNLQNLAASSIENYIVFNSLRVTDIQIFFIIYQQKDKIKTTFKSLKITFDHYLRK